MASYVNTTLKGQVLSLDENEFTNCTLEGCTLVYSGGERMRLDGCRMRNCHFNFDGPAERALLLMHRLYHSGGKELIEATFENIRNPNWAK